MPELVVGPHLHAADRRAGLEDTLQRGVAVGADVLRGQAFDRGLHAGLDVVLPDAQREVDAVVRRRSGNGTEHGEVALPIGGREAGHPDLGERREVEPERVGRSQVVGLVREDEVEAVEALPGQHPEEGVPVLL